MMMLGVLKCKFIQFKDANIVKLSQIIYDYWDFNAEINKIDNVSAGFAMKQ